MREIVMFGGVKTQVDDEDYERASEITWHADHYDSGIVYARCRRWFPLEKKHRNISLHRFLMDFPKGKSIDHIDGNGLNNQRSNLRACSRAENARNMRKHGDGKNKYKGVHPYGKQFEAYITFNRTRYYLGAYATEEGAGTAYNAAAREFFGEYCHLNRSLPLTATPPDGVPTFSEWIKKNMPGFSLVTSKVPGGEEVQHGREDDRVQGDDGRPHGQEDATQKGEEGQGPASPAA